MKIFGNYLLHSSCSMLLFFAFFCSNADAVPVKYVPLDDSIKPVVQSSSDIYKAVGLDLLIPGYGSFAFNRPYRGYSIAALKIAGAGLIYYTAKNYIYWHSVNNAVRASPDGGMNAGTGAPSVLFQNPDNPDSYLSARDIQNRRDSAFLYLLYASLFEVAVYGVSAWLTWDMASEHYQRSGPLYKFGEIENDVRIDLGWQQTY